MRLIYSCTIFLQTALRVSDDTLIHHREHTETVITTSGTDRIVFATVRWREVETVWSCFRLYCQPKSNLSYFYVHGSLHRESLSIIVQQNATIYSCIIFSADSSTCFGWYPHPSSGAHWNCNYIWHWSNRICNRPLTWRRRNSVPTSPRQRTVANTIRSVPDVVITVWVCSWWLMRVSSEICRAVCRKYNTTVYSSILLDNYWHIRLF